MTQSFATCWILNHLKCSYNYIIYLFTLYLCLLKILYKNIFTYLFDILKNCSLRPKFEKKARLLEFFKKCCDMKRAVQLSDIKPEFNGNLFCQLIFIIFNHKSESAVQCSLYILLKKNLSWWSLRLKVNKHPATKMSLWEPLFDNSVD